MSVIVFRLDQKEGILTGRSECAKCSTRLKWYDLVPLLSYLWLGGKCRYCKERISALYPVMELFMASSFATYYIFNGPYIDLSNIYDLALIFLLVVLIFFDHIYMILPDKIIGAGIALFLLYSMFLGQAVFWNGLAMGFGLALFFGIIFLVSRGEWMGFGDVKLVFLIGCILGFPNALFSLMVSVWIGALWGIYLMLTSKAGLKTALPFGSYICGVAIIFIIFKEYTYIIF